MLDTYKEYYPLLFEPAFVSGVIIYGLLGLIIFSYFVYDFIKGNENTRNIPLFRICCLLFFIPHTALFLIILSVHEMLMKPNHKRQLQS